MHGKIAEALLIAAALFSAPSAGSIHPPRILPAPSPGPAATRDGTVYHVTTNGSDANPGTDSRPFRTVQKGVAAARPGDTILVHGGTYEGVVRITRSGTPEAPIVLAGAGDGAATLTASFDELPCTATAPTRQRTLQVLSGADHWTIRDLTIVNGIAIVGTNTQVLQHSDFLDRTLPGHSGARDSAAAERVLGRFRVDAADFIRLQNLDVSGRGLLTLGARYGELIDSRIHDVECGTGAAVWINRFSHYWKLRGNEVEDVAASAKHWMSEGIRLGSGSSYGVIEGNVVRRLGGPGRGIATDVGASWNVIRNNRVEEAAVSFSEQAGGSGNQYISNVSVSSRRFGYQIHGEGQKERSLTRATPRLLRFECNDSRDDPVDLVVGNVTESVFLNNNFAEVKVGPHLRRSWDASGNIWNATSDPPGPKPATEGFSSCPDR